jgi:hypothetical protein
MTWGEVESEAVVPGWCLLESAALLIGVGYFPGRLLARGPWLVLYLHICQAFLSKQTLCIKAIRQIAMRICSRDFHFYVLESLDLMTTPQVCRIDGGGICCSEFGIRILRVFPPWI